MPFERARSWNGAACCTGGNSRGLSAFDGPARERAGLRGHRSHRGFTLAEVLASAIVLGVLAAGTMSAMLIASHAFPSKRSTHSRALEGGRALHQINEDLMLATSLPEYLGTTITFNVPDRGHGSAGDETVLYEWSGVPGSPLVRQYNGSSKHSICDDVHLFSLSYTYSLRPPQTPPRVLLMMLDALTPLSNDAAKRTLMESWGMQVTPIAALSPQATFDAELARHDVIYVASGSLTLGPSPVLATTTLGVIAESDLNASTLGIANSVTAAPGNELNIADRTHSITSVWPTDPVTIFEAQEVLMDAQPPLAAGARLLGVSPVGNDRLLVVLESGAMNISGLASPGRRVKLPWGQASIDIDNLTSDGRTLMQRAINWAAATRVVTGVRVDLQVGSHAGALMQTSIRLLNEPRADGT